MSGRLVLASRSPRRMELLEEAGYAFTLCPARREELRPAPRERAEAYALRAARAKAEEVAEKLGGEGQPGDVVLAADTVVDLEGEILGQPTDRDEARRMLARLSGSRHAVVTAIVLRKVGSDRSAEAVERTEIDMRSMTADEIAEYVTSGEPIGKAGGYAIQESGDRFVRVLSGSRTNVVGLPMERLAALICSFAPALAPRDRLDEDAGCPTV